MILRMVVGLVLTVVACRGRSEGAADRRHRAAEAAEVVGAWRGPRGDVLGLHRVAVLGPAESCTGDPARRLGNEFVFQMLAQQNVQTLGGNYEVIHHTQLLARLVEEGKLTPVIPIEEKITYHDPCFLGRHNKIYTPPRAIIDAVPGTQAEEMHRCKGKGFCCGAGGARMWLEERAGKRINEERIDEALALDPDTVSTACP